MPVRLCATLLILLGLAACASAPNPAEDEPAAYDEAYDPLEPVNRTIFNFNRGVDFWIVRPVAVFYRDIVPPTVQDMVRNFLDNLRQPLNAANALLQGRPDRAGQALGRFSTNTFIGVLGLFDVVPEVPQVEEDFGQTLAVWGVPEGPYLVLPLLGPSNPRDAVGLAVDTYADPFNYVANQSDNGSLVYVRSGTRAVDSRSRNIATLDEIERSAIDFYAKIRSLYRQQRRDAIRNGGGEAVAPLDLSLDTDDDVRPQAAAENR